ncbi:MAG: serine protease [Sandaracinaceae bacterium]|nr:serine protease [Sandaracinaceae bacterium]
MQHVLTLSFDTTPPGSSTSEPSSCTGVLVGPDLVLTAGHCVVGTRFINADTCARNNRPGRTMTARFDHQMIHNTDVFGGPRGVTRVSRIVPIGVTELLAVPGDYLEPRVEDERQTCIEHGEWDLALVRLERPVASRGFARIRLQNPTPGSSVPVIHHPGGNPKRLVVGRVRTDAPGETDIRLHDIDLPPHLAFERDSAQLTDRSSGSPVFDEEGFVVGIYSHGQPKTGDASHVFTSLAHTIAALNGDYMATSGRRLGVSTETSQSGLGVFRATPLGDFNVRYTDLSSGPERPNALARRPDGSFVTAGYATSAAGEHVLALAGYDPSGAPDPTFGAITEDILGSTHEELVDIQYQDFGGGRLVAVGNLSGPDEIAILRYLPSGARDLMFAPDGVQRYAPGDRVPHAGGIAVDPVEQSIIVAGDTGLVLDPAEGRPFGSPFVIRLEPDGGVDDRCDGSGVFVWRPEATRTPDPIERFDQLRTIIDRGVVRTYDMVVSSVAVDAAGRILIAGHLTWGDFHGRQAWVGRLTRDCRPDVSFGPNGSGVTLVDTRGFALDADNAWASAVVADATGRIYVGGTAARFDSNRGFFAGRMFVAALRPDGSLDRAFGFAGTEAGVTVTPVGWHEETRAMSISVGTQPLLVVAGESYGGDGDRRWPRLAMFGTEGVPGRPDPTRTWVWRRGRVGDRRGTRA